MDDQFDVMVPVRVDLSGGWTDVNPYCTDFGGEVVNFTINKYVKARIDDSGEIAYDVSGNNNHGKIFNPVWITENNDKYDIILE